MTPTRSLAYSVYSGKFTPDNPRGIGANALATLDEAIHAASNRLCDRIILQRRWGMFEKDIGNSWECEDDMFHRLMPNYDDMLYKYAGLHNACEEQGITLAHVVGLNAPDGLPLDMAIPAHRACLRRVCERAREQGATELWVDTGGDIENADVGDIESMGDGVRHAANIAAECGIVLVPEWTTNLSDVYTPTYFRIRRNANDDPRTPIVPVYGQPVFALTGTNGGGVETPETNQAYADAGCIVTAWNANARKQALAPAGDVGEVGT